MNPSGRFSLSLLASLFLWRGSALACFRGEITLATAGLRYLVAFGVAHLATGLVSRLMNAYRHPHPPGGPGGSAPPARRHRDQPQTEQPQTEQPPPAPVDAGHAN